MNRGKQSIIEDIESFLNDLDTFHLRQVMAEFIKYFSVKKTTASTRRNMIENILSRDTLELIGFISHLIDSKIIECTV